MIVQRNPSTNTRVAQQYNGARSSPTNQRFVNPSPAEMQDLARALFETCKIKDRRVMLVMPCSEVPQKPKESENNESTR
jgi:hypothetical protein